MRGTGTNCWPNDVILWPPIYSALGRYSIVLGCIMGYIQGWLRHWWCADHVLPVTRMTRYRGSTFRNFRYVKLMCCAVGTRLVDLCFAVHAVARMLHRMLHGHWLVHVSHVTQLMTAQKRCSLFVSRWTFHGGYLSEMVVCQQQDLPWLAAGQFTSWLIVFLLGCTIGVRVWEIQGCSSLYKQRVRV